jgi:hypothetical protein
MTAFLEGITAGDLGIFVNGEDFIAVQSMNERFSKSVQYRRTFGSDNPTIRTMTPADANTVSFSFIILKAGVVRGLNSYQTLQAMEDFEIQTKKGSTIETYMGCNWTDIAIDSGIEIVTANVDISVPGFRNT